MLCSGSDLSSSWDAYLGHVLAMLLGINEMCLPGRFLMWNVSRKLFWLLQQQKQTSLLWNWFFQNLFEEFYTSVRMSEKSGVHTQM